jgi:hypothetical protein
MLGLQIKFTCESLATGPTMPELVQSLRQQDHGYLQIAAQLWGFILSAREFPQACDELANLILDQAKTKEFFEPLNDGDIVRSVHLLKQADASCGANLCAIRHARDGTGKRDARPSFLNRLNHRKSVLQGDLGEQFSTRQVQWVAYIPSDLLEKLATGINLNNTRTRWYQYR